VEHRLLTLAAEADQLAAFVPDEERLHVAALLATARRETRESKERVAALVGVVGDA
jgi:hypothetical protein